MEIKDILKGRRLAYGLTMKQLGDKIGVSASTISRWESGEIADMRRDKVVALSNTLHIEPAVIMGWKEPEEIPVMTQDESDLLDRFQELNEAGQAKLLEYLDDLSDMKKYRR